MPGEALTVWLRPKKMPGGGLNVWLRAHLKKGGDGCLVMLDNSL